MKTEEKNLALALLKRANRDLLDAQMAMLQHAKSFTYDHEADAALGPDLAAAWRFAEKAESAAVDAQRALEKVAVEA